MHSLLARDLAQAVARDRLSSAAWRRSAAVESTPECGCGAAPTLAKRLILRRTDRSRRCDPDPVAV